MAKPLPINVTEGYWYSSNYLELIQYVVNFVQQNGSTRVQFHGLGLFHDAENVQDIEIHMPRQLPLDLVPDTPNIRQEIFNRIQGIEKEENMGNLIKSGLSLTAILGYSMQINRFKPNPLPQRDEYVVPETIENFNHPVLRNYTNNFLNTLIMHDCPEIKRWCSTRCNAKIQHAVSQWCQFYNLNYFETPNVHISNVKAWMKRYPFFKIRVFDKDANVIIEPYNANYNLKWDNNKFYVVKDYERWMTPRNHTNMKVLCNDCGKQHKKRRPCDYEEFPTENTQMSPQVFPKTRHRMVAYADFEAFTKEDGVQEASGYGIVFINHDNEIHYQEHYSGVDVVERFFECIQQTYANLQEHVRSDFCPHCKQSNLNERVHHGICFCCAEEGSFHIKCWKESRNILPIYFHNLKGYDSHLLLKKFADFGKPQHTFITGKTMEKLEMLQYTDYNYRIRFSDTLAYLTTSLAELVKACKTWKHTPVDERDSKGIFPYSWFDSISKLEHPTLPETAEDWFNKLSREGVDPTHAIQKFREKGFTSFKQWHDYYMMNDVYQLADVFEEFRTSCIEECGLDPVYKMSAPGYAMQIALEKTPVPFEVTTNIDVYNEISSNIRGGVAQCCKRYVKVDQPGQYVKYLDVNGLYSYCMMQLLPNKFVSIIQNESEIMLFNKPGYCLLINCDITYPQHLHDKHYQFPLCPHKYLNRLCTTFKDKEKILILDQHYNFLIEQGLEIVVNYAMVFTAEYLLKDFVMQNNEKRKLTTAKSKSNLYKLLNNSVYGKTCENVRKYRDFRIVESFDHENGTINQFLQDTSSHMQLTDTKMLADFKLKSVILNKPVQIGFAILEYAKLHIEKFLCQIWNTFGVENVELVYTDTDSVMLEFTNQDCDPINKMIIADLPIDPQNTKEPGLWADEVDGKTIVEVVGLGAKRYAIKYSDDSSTLKNKGVMRSARKENDKRLEFEDYKAALFSDIEVRVTQAMLRSKNQEISFMVQDRLALISRDIKRDVLEDRIHTLPWFYNGDKFQPSLESQLRWIAENESQFEPDGTI